MKREKKKVKECKFYMIRFVKKIGSKEIENSLGESVV